MPSSAVEKSRCHAPPVSPYRRGTAAATSACATAYYGGLRRVDATSAVVVVTIGACAAAPCE